MTGGHDSNSSEILRDKKWTVLANGNLPGSKTFGLGLTSLDNQVFAFGKLNVHFQNNYTYAYNYLVFLGGYEYNTKSTTATILNFNIDEGRWYQSYNMSRSRAHFGISVVDFQYYSDACIDKADETTLF